MKFLFISMLSLASIVVNAETVTSIVAEDLVRAMHFDRLAFKGYFSPFFTDRALHKNAESAEEMRFLACLEDVADNPIVIKAFAIELEKQMSPEEMTLALEFYNGPVGKKVHQRNVNIVSNQYGLSTEINNVELSPVELAELKKFEDTAASKALGLFPTELRRTRSAYEALFSEGEKILKACTILTQKSKTGG